MTEEGERVVFYFVLLLESETPVGKRLVLTAARGETT